MAETDSEGGRRRDVGPLRGDPFGARLYAVAEGLAVLGGISLLVVTALTVTSVVGRTGFATPILGDQEIVELGCAVAIFAFMPYCQMRAANVIVDFFTAGLSQATRDALDVLMNAIFSFCILIVTWRLGVGGVAAYKAADASMFLRLPLWWGYAFAFVACVVWSLACLYSVARSFCLMREARAAARAGTAP